MEDLCFLPILSCFSTQLHMAGTNSLRFSHQLAGRLLAFCPDALLQIGMALRLATFRNGFLLGIESPSPHPELALCLPPAFPRLQRRSPTAAPPGPPDSDGLPQSRCHVTPNPCRRPADVVTEVGARLAVPSWFGHARHRKRVRLAVPAHPDAVIVEIQVATGKPATKSPYLNILVNVKWIPKGLSIGDWNCPTASGVRHKSEKRATG